MRDFFIRNIYNRATSALAFIEGGADFEKAKSVLPFFYYILFFSAFTHLEGLNYVIAQGGGGFSARLPLFWAAYVNFDIVVTAVFLGLMFSALVASLFPFSRTARTLAFLGILQYHAYSASFGGPNHQWDHWLWIALILIFLPTIRTEPSRDTRRMFSLVFWTAQAYLLLTYSMAGIGKVIYGVIQFAEGQSNAFFPDAGALFASTQLNLMGETVPLASLIINNPMLAWIPFLLMLEIQTFAIVAAFRPQLHRIWGVGLVLFHIGTFLTMRAVFVAPSALLLLFLVSSPFAPDRARVREIVLAVPILGTIIRMLARSFRA